MFQIKQKLAVVTGGSRGIGQAIANLLGKQGAYVAATATSQTGADKITSNLAEAGIEGRGFVLNVNDKEALPAFLNEVNEHFAQHPAILVNNAGITRDNIVLRMKDEQWGEVIETNLNAIFRLTKACLKPMVKARYGRVINLTSVSGLTGNFGQSNYSAAKAGVNAFSKSLALEVARFGITVNCVSPGFTKTDMVQAMKEEVKAKIEAQIPVGRIAQATEIAAAVLYLASDEASYVTGANLNINGGLYMA